MKWFDPNPTPDLVLLMYKTGTVVFPLPVSMGNRMNELDPEFEGALSNSKFSILVSSIHEGNFKALDQFRN